MCLVVKDEAQDVVEWIEHHQALGVGKFYIFDHGSTTPLLKQLYPLVHSGVVTYEYFRYCQPHLLSTLH